MFFRSFLSLFLLSMSVCAEHFIETDTHIYMLADLPDQFPGRTMYGFKSIDKKTGKTTLQRYVKGRPAEMYPCSSGEILIVTKEGWQDHINLELYDPKNHKRSETLFKESLKLSFWTVYGDYFYFVENAHPHYLQFFNFLTKEQGRAFTPSNLKNISHIKRDNDHLILCQAEPVDKETFVSIFNLKNKRLEHSNRLEDIVDDIAMTTDHIYFSTKKGFWQYHLQSGEKLLRFHLNATHSLRLKEGVAYLYCKQLSTMDVYNLALNKYKSFYVGKTNSFEVWGNYLYTSSDSEGYIDVYDCTTGKKIATREVGWNPEFIKVYEDGVALIYCYDSNGRGNDPEVYGKYQTFNPHSVALVHLPTTRHLDSSTVLTDERQPKYFARYQNTLYVNGEKTFFDSCFKEVAEIEGNIQLKRFWVFFCYLDLKDLYRIVANSADIVESLYEDEDLGKAILKDFVFQDLLSAIEKLKKGLKINDPFARTVMYLAFKYGQWGIPKCPLVAEIFYLEGTEPSLIKLYEEEQKSQKKG